MIGLNVHAAKTFVDYDGTVIARGTDLGVLVKMGKLGGGGQAYNTIKDGKVTSVFVGDFSSKVSAS